jgi:hypothetical protein
MPLEQVRRKADPALYLTAAGDEETVFDRQDEVYRAVQTVQTVHKKMETAVVLPIPVSGACDI